MIFERNCVNNSYRFDRIVANNDQIAWEAMECSKIGIKALIGLDGFLDFHCSPQNFL